MAQNHQRILCYVLYLCAVSVGTSNASLAFKREEDLVTKVDGDCQHATFVIGDLHGDAECTRQWVSKTGMIANFDSPSSESWTWTDPTSTIVFMGDYTDKGPTCKQTMELVKSMTDKFPNYVTALMGNHELELLFDRNGNRDEWAGHRFMDLAYASVHPLEYKNYFPADGDTSVDDGVIDAILNATIEVYGAGRHGETVIIPKTNKQTTKTSIIDFVQPPSARAAVEERLSIFQSNYISTFRSGSELGSWLEQRPLFHIERGTIFVHGGIRPNESVIQTLSKAILDIETFNKNMALNLQQNKMDTFSDDIMGQIVYDLVTFRGNHPPRGTCRELASILSVLGVSRLAVGHTPDDSVRVSCEGKFLALDSSLSRWFRAHGNEYCHGEYQYTSRNGASACAAINQSCQGQIIKLGNDGNVQLLDDRDLKLDSVFMDL